MLNICFVRTESLLLHRTQPLITQFVTAVCPPICQLWQVHNPFAILPVYPAITTLVAQLTSINEHS